MNGILDYLEGVFSSDIEKMKRYSNVSWSEKVEKEGQIASLLTVLSLKGEVSEKLEKKIQTQTKNELLDQWLKIAVAAPDVGTFEKQIGK